MHFQHKKLGLLCASAAATRSVVPIFDLLSRRCFVIDTGAEVSVLPVSGPNTLIPQNLRLAAANSTPIHTYDYRPESRIVPNVFVAARFGRHRHQHFKRRLTLLLWAAGETAE